MFRTAANFPLLFKLMISYKELSQALVDRCSLAELDELHILPDTKSVFQDCVFSKPRSLFALQ